jgi:dynein heavy chain 1
LPPKKKIHNICLVINEDEQPTQGQEYFLEEEPTLKSFPSTNIIFIKKIPYLDCSDQKKIKKDLQILNFSTESNDTSMLSHIQNCIQNAFLSLFNSYKEFIDEKKDSTIKSNNANQLCFKTGELVDIINKTQKVYNIPKIKLEPEPFLYAKMEKIKNEKGREATLDELYENLDDIKKNDLYNILNKWKTDISQITKMDRELKDGNTLDEVTFWNDYLKALKNIKKQVESYHVQMTLSIAKKDNKTFITNPFENDSKTDEYIKKANSYNILLKDLPIKEMYNANSIEELSKQIQKIFEVIRKQIKQSSYPLTRVNNLVECINEDMYSRVIKLLGPNLMSINYQDFEDLYGKCENLFSKIWSSEFEILKKELVDLAKKKSESYTPPKNTFPHSELQRRLTDIKKFRVENKELIDITLKLNKSNNSVKNEESQITKDIKAAYKLTTEIDVLDISKHGVDTWLNAKTEYNKVIEKIEGQISSSLTEQLASTQNVNEQFRIFEKFKVIIRRPRIQSAIQDYQQTLINSVTKDLNSLKDKLSAGYENSSAAKLCSIRGLPPISGEIIWNNQFEEQAILYRYKIASILGDSWENTEEGKKLKSLIESFINISANGKKKKVRYGLKVIVV